MKRAFTILCILAMTIGCIDIRAEEHCDHSHHVDENVLFEDEIVLRRGPACMCGGFMDYHSTVTGVEYYDGTQDCIHMPVGLDEIYKTKITKIYKCSTCQRTKEYVSYKIRTVCKGSYL